MYYSINILECCINLFYVFRPHFGNNFTFPSKTRKNKLICMCAFVNFESIFHVPRNGFKCLFYILPCVHVKYSVYIKTARTGSSFSKKWMARIYLQLSEQEYPFLLILIIQIFRKKNRQKNPVKIGHHLSRHTCITNEENAIDSFTNSLQNKLSLAAV